MAKTKTIVKHCAKCNKPFSTADDSVVLCRECTSKELKDEAAKELERQNEVAETRTCTACGKSFDITVGSKEFFEKRGLNLPNLCPDCRELLKKRKKELGGLEHTCKTCGKPFSYGAVTVLKSALFGWELSQECPDCRKAKREKAKEAREANQASKADRQKVVATVVCKECGKEFVVTAGEQEFLKSHGLDNLPTHCPECRHKRKVRVLAEDMRRFGDKNEAAEETVVMSDATPLDNIQTMMSDIAPAPEATSTMAITGTIDEDAGPVDEAAAAAEPAETPASDNTPADAADNQTAEAEPEAKAEA